MIPVPQPRRPSATDEPPPAAGLVPDAGPPPAAASRRAAPRGPVIAVVTVVALLVLAGVVAAVAVVLGAGFDLVLIGLIVAFLLFGALGLVLRLLPASLPFVPAASRLLSFVSLAALAGLLYLYAYPAITHNTTWPGTSSAPRPGVSLTRQASIVYTLTGSGGAEISAESPLPSGEVAPATVEALPYEHSASVTVNRRTPGLFTLVASSLAAGDDGQLACTITVDGVVVAHDEASGAHATVFCSGKPQ